MLGGEFHYSGGAVVGTVHAFNSTIEVADTVTATSTVIASGNSTLESNDSSSVTVWVQGSGRFGDATLGISGPADNAGTIRLESVDSTWNSSIAVEPGDRLTNRGRIETRLGAGGARGINGVVINQGELTVEPTTSLTITGEYELAGGRNEGPAYVVNSEVRVTDSPAAATTILLGGSNTLTTGNLSNVTLWVQGSGTFGNGLLTEIGRAHV